MKWAFFQERVVWGHLMQLPPLYNFLLKRKEKRGEKDKKKRAFLCNFIILKCPERETALLAPSFHMSK